ncbi:MAG: ABC transporter permease [Candidatus Acidiferrales bacterium]|jgi:putative ABC transport system permease protein|nr:ABC transporter permease [Candidatus Acidoferrales bacterium]
MRILFQDIRFGLRVLAKSPGFTAVAVLTLAIGIGANTAIFSVVNAVLLRPLPYPNHNSLLRVEETHPGENSTALTYATFLDLERDVTAIQNTSAFRPWVFNVTGEREPEQVPGAMVSGNFFSALGSKPFLGRVIRKEDDQPGGDNRVTVLSYAFWQRRYGGQRAIVGKSVQVNAQDFVVIGVMPPGFDFPEQAEMWCPLVAGGEFHNNRRAHLLTVVGDLAPGTSPGKVNAELASFAARVTRENPGVDDPGLTITAVSLKNSLVAPLRPALVILIFAVGLLLLIACANVANLLLARGAARRKEIAIRLAIGAGRSRLVRQLLTESVLLSLLGGVLGLGVASWSLSFIIAANAKNIPELIGVNLDWSVLVFTLMVSVLTGLLFGLVPALAGIKTDLNASLKEAGAVSTGARHRMSNESLIVLQFTLAVILLAGAGLLGNSFVRLLRVNPGFNPKNVLTMQVFLSPVQFPEGDPKGAVVLHQMLERVRAVPGVRSAGLVISLPLTGGPSTDFVISGRPAPRLGDEPSADILVIDPGYLQTMQIPLLAGREFTERDNQNSARVMIINQTMARQFWPNESPIGKRVTMKDWGPPLTGEIVGVAGDVKINGLDAAIGPAIYWPYSQFPVNFNAIVVRGDTDPLRLVSAVKSQIWSVDKNQPISKIATMEQVLSDSIAQRRLYLVLLGVFAGAALLLAAVGIYGVMSYSVSQRTHEMGIRLALGAPQTEILKLILGRGAKLALLGVATGILAATALTRLMSSLLFGVSPSDPATLAAVAVLLMLVAMAACYIPARRAMRVDPMIALRYE